MVVDDSDIVIKELGADCTASFKDEFKREKGQKCSLERTPLSSDIIPMQRARPPQDKQLMEEDTEDTQDIKVHELKTWPIVYQDLIDGKKRFEYRINDRDFQVGDRLLLKEWLAGKYTGRSCLVKVVHSIRGPNYNVPCNYIIMSIEVISVVH